jgi:hypothetical protein
MVGRFALIAWRAQCGISGVKTFIVNQDDVVDEKDFGDDTAGLANQIVAFDPDKSWSRVEEGEGR